MAVNKPIINNTNNDEDDGEVFMRQAFMIPTIPDNFDPSIPPSNGEEYLQHVLFESKKYANVFIAERVDPATLNAQCDSKLIDLKPSLLASPLEPSNEWKTDQVNKFIKLRNTVLDIRLKKLNQNKSKILVPHVDAGRDKWLHFLSSHEPLLSVVLILRQEQLERILQVLLQVNLEGSFNVQHGAWVYAICACLEHPLSREACGELRDIARKCAIDRNKKKDPQDKELKMMNLIITLVVHYFKQHDLDKSS